jgi:two-component system KDP operon response regulator KdpE
MATIAKKRVLLVDDDPELVESVRIALMSHGYEVLVACDGAEALSRVE